MQRMVPHSPAKELFYIISVGFLLFSTYELDVLRASDGLGLPKEFIPLDSFEGEVGFFYNKQTEEVFQFSLNRSTENSTQLTTLAKWDTFDLFLDWYL